MTSTDVSIKSEKDILLLIPDHTVCDQKQMSNLKMCFNHPEFQRTRCSISLVYLLTKPPKLEICLSIKDHILREET